ncbi:adenylosuccinate synthetase [Patescibacteria group bacterium]|nr:adenylosuccinate synthetase [Patescibacteria group bacterium]
MGAIVVVDAFWGDGGKGVRSAWESLISDAKMVLRGCGGPGAEHGTFINGKYLKTNQLPLGFLLKGCSIGLGPGTAVDPVKLFEEVKRYNIDPKQIKIDPRCPIVTQENIRQEKESANMKKIGSTFSGTGRCMSDAILRVAPLAEDIPELAKFISDIPIIANSLAKKGNIILESSQSFGLSRYFGTKNYVTSVDVTTGSLIAGVGLDWRHLNKVILVVKALPTREGAGPMGQVEEFTVGEMENLGIIEFSSIADSKRGKLQIRRKAKGIDWDMLKKAAMVTGATEITLTFAEHYDPNVKDITEWTKITPKVFELVKKIEDVTNAPVTMINTGKPITSMASKFGRLPDLNTEIVKRLNSYC